MLVAVLAGAIIGIQREVTGKAAGLRTHILVALGTTVFVLGTLEHGFENDALSRVIQGLITGIGFLGAGTILKLTHEQTIHGLTTAGSVWVTAAIGVAVGLGQLAVAVVAVVLTWIVLAVLVRLELRLAPAEENQRDL